MFIESASKRISPIDDSGSCIGQRAGTKLKNYLNLRALSVDYADARITHEPSASPTQRTVSKHLRSLRSLAGGKHRLMKKWLINTRAV